MAEPARGVGDEALAPGGEVGDAVQRAGIERGELEHGDVGSVADAQVAAAVEGGHVGELPRELADALLQRHHVTITHPEREEVEREVRVAHLVDVCTGVGEPEHAAVAAQELLDDGSVVVREHDAEARVEVVGECDVDRSVERVDAPLARDRRDAASEIARVRRGLVDRELLPVRVDILLGRHLGPGA